VLIVKFRRAISPAITLEQRRETGHSRKGEDKMPWYMNPVMTRKVLNRIANRYPKASLQDLDALLDYTTQTLWSKQERFLEKKQAA
jgi:hypothetical protein